MRCRLLERGDEDQLVYLSKCQVLETLPHMPYEEDVVRFHIDHALTGDSGITVFVVEHDEGHLIGYLIALKSQYFFCRAYCAEQEVMYVLPAYRGTRAAYLLVRSFMQWADDQGALETYTGVANGFNVDRTSRFLSRMGFDHVGHFFRKVRSRHEVPV